MKFASCVFILLASVTLPVSADDMEDVKQEVLESQTKHVISLGLAKFCKKPGLAHVIMSQISDGVVEAKAKHGFSQSVAVSILMLADAQARGMASGIRMGQPSAARARGLCELLISEADNLLIEQAPKVEP